MNKITQNNPGAVALSATADPGCEGRQCVGRVTGPGDHRGIAVDLGGDVRGTRRQTTTLTVTRPGLFRVRGVSAKQVTDRYVLVWRLDGELVETTVTEAGAVVVAHDDLSAARIDDAGRRHELAYQLGKLSDADVLDPDEVIHGYRLPDAGKLGLHGGGDVRRSEVTALRRRLVDRIIEASRAAGESAGAPPPTGESGGSPRQRRSRLVRERVALTARIADIDGELGELNG